MSRGFTTGTRARDTWGGTRAGVIGGEKVGWEGGEKVGERVG